VVDTSKGDASKTKTRGGVTGGKRTFVSPQTKWGTGNGTPATFGPEGQVEEVSQRAQSGNTLQRRERGKVFAARKRNLKEG